MKSLSIIFVPLHINNNSGSFRIWVNDYNKYFNSIGVSSKIIIAENLTQDEILKADIIILGKSMRGYMTQTFESLKKAKDSLIVGTITPPCDMHIPFDFVMAGSLEEYDSLSFHKNVILNAHIESLYHNEPIKHHGDGDTFKICYHGWTPHLYSLVCGLQNAIERFDKIGKKVELHVITEHTKDSIDWKRESGKPDVNVIYKKWDINSVKENIQECDIGICPGVYDLTTNDKLVDNKKGKFNTDYIIRYKNKTNNGRAIVFMQLGIPVIADFSPSNFHLFGDMSCGRVAHTEHGWYSALKYYSYCKNRNKVAANAKSFVNTYYNPQDWAARYYQSLLEIKAKKDK